MIALVRLGALGIALSVCHGYCYVDDLKHVLQDGRPVELACVDVYDGSIHRIGDLWNTEKCMECTCNTIGMHCCTRYGGTIGVGKGCIAEVDQTTCQYKFYKEEDRSEPCFEEGN